MSLPAVISFESNGLNTALNMAPNGPLGPIARQWTPAAFVARGGVSRVGVELCFSGVARRGFSQKKIGV